MKGEKGIQGDNSDVLSVLADHLPIQLVTRYGEKCAVSSTMYNQRIAAWHFDAKFVYGQGH